MSVSGGVGFALFGVGAVAGPAADEISGVGGCGEGDGSARGDFASGGDDGAGGSGGDFAIVGVGEDDGDDQIGRAELGGEFGSVCFQEARHSGVAEDFGGGGVVGERFAGVRGKSGFVNLYEAVQGGFAVLCVSDVGAGVDEDAEVCEAAGVGEVSGVSAFYDVKEGESSAVGFSVEVYVSGFDGDGHEVVQSPVCGADLGGGVSPGAVASGGVEAGFAEDGEEGDAEGVVDGVRVEVAGGGVVSEESGHGDIVVEVPSSVVAGSGGGGSGSEGDVCAAFNDEVDDGRNKGLGGEVGGDGGGEGGLQRSVAVGGAVFDR